MLISFLFNLYRLALSIPMIDGKYSKCSMYAKNFTEMINANETLVADPSWPIQSCVYGWEYDRSEIPYETIATEVYYYIEDLPNMIQLLYLI